jgi:hypothetical protein
VRRSVFIDVENASRPEHVARVLDHLGLDWTDRRTDLVAVGNWRVISPDTARLLAHRGAQLVHSAPSAGVRDWSDLRIAVAAGVWLAAARPGDSIEIVSNDQAFDAIGDVAASLGVAFRRLSIHALDGGHAAAPPDRAPAGRRPSRRGRRGRGGRGGPRRPHAAAERPHTIHHAPPAEAAAEAALAPDLHPHPAPAEEIRKTVEELLATSPQGVMLDALSRTLKAHGFRRPPGSLRLITRLRHLKGIEVTRTGLVRLVASHPAHPVTEPEASPEPDQPVADSAAPATAPGHPPRGASRRRGRRGGRRRRRPASEASTVAAPASQDAPESAAEAPSG